MGGRHTVVRALGPSVCLSGPPAALYGSPLRLYLQRPAPLSYLHGIFVPSPPFGCTEMLRLLALALLAGCTRASDVLELTDDDFESRIGSHDMILVEFFAPW